MKNQYPSMQAKTCVVTGGSSGLGKATALALARLGAEVIIVNHNLERGLAALNEIQQKSGSQTVQLYQADLSSQAEVRQLADALNTRYPQIHVLINVAGGMFRGIHYSTDHLEMNFALNYLSYFLLTNCLLDKLVQSAPARIINVTSIAHWWGQVNLGQPGVGQYYLGQNDQADQRKHRYYSMFSAYGNSKLAIILFTRELASRLRNTNVTAYSVHPGIVATKLTERVIDHPIVGSLVDFLFLTPGEGAESLVYLAAAQEADQLNGEYIVRRRPGWCSKASRDPQIGKKLWEMSEELTQSHASVEPGKE